MKSSSENNDSLIKELQAANKKISELEAALKNSSREEDNKNLTSTEKTLQKYGVHFQNIIDASPVPYALNDDNNNIIYINPAFTKTFGYLITDIPTLSDWWPKAYPDQTYRDWVSKTWIEHLNEAIDTGNSFEPVEINIRCKNNEQRTVIASAASITDSYKHIHLVTLFDITDRQYAEVELEKTVSLLDNVINSTPDLIFVKNNQLQTILCNLAYANAVGKTREEMYGNTDIENGWDVELVMGNEEKGIRGFMHDDRDALAGIPIHNTNDPANVDGKVLIFDTRKLPLKDTKNNIIGLLGVARDITGLLNTEHQLRRSQKMDALGKLTGGIAHDFNNMLGVILGYSELMESSLKDEKHIRYIKEIIQAGNRSKTLTSKLLAFAKKQPSDALAININDVLQRDQHMLETTLTAKINLSLKLQNQLWSILVDPELLADAILNLSINAMHAMPEGGELIFETYNLTIEETLAYSLSVEPGDYVQLSITDTGCGMDNQVKEHIFEPFFSTKGESGTGLGLSQVYGFTQQSKSQIVIDSVKGQGTTASIYFPRFIASQKIDTKPDNTISNHKQPNHEKILVVDDEPALRGLAYDILSTQGYDVLCAESGAAALEILNKNTVDLMVTDIIMPEMDGYELCNAVKQTFPEMKILVSSGYSDDIHLAHKDEELQEKQLNKPYKSKELINRVRELLDQ